MFVWQTSSFLNLSSCTCHDVKLMQQCCRSNWCYIVLCKYIRTTPHVLLYCLDHLYIHIPGLLNKNCMSSSVFTWSKAFTLKKYAIQSCETYEQLLTLRCRNLKEGNFLTNNRLDNLKTYKSGNMYFMISWYVILLLHMPHLRGICNYTFWHLLHVQIPR